MPDLTVDLIRADLRRKGYMLHERAHGEQGFTYLHYINRAAGNEAPNMIVLIVYPVAGKRERPHVAFLMEDTAAGAGIEGRKDAREIVLALPNVVEDEPTRD